MMAAHADPNQEHIMHSTFTPVTHLQRHQAFTLRGRPGQRLEVRTGEVWVTQDGDPRDLVLGARQCFTLDRSGRVVISALDDAAFTFRTEAQPARKTQAAPSLGTGLVPAGCY
jgi:hypothetical protein